ncbi:MAG: DUF4878 domain-containing protein [Arachidicoccus sp.]|nr:DUF4878 domain-containing protein [Arachidicoccus sp.]
MKKILSVIAFLFATAFFFSCKNSSSPSSVASAFTKAMITQDFVNAKKYVVSANTALIDQMAAFSKQMAMPDSILQIIKQAVIKTKNEKITGNTATVDVEITLPKAIMGQTEQTQTLNLKKEKNEWKIDLGNPDMLSPDQAQEQSQPSQMPADSSLKSLPTLPDSAEK